ncbi:response regulator transcription factor [Novosphingobium mangrovi (ex Hu et al. 2023)]|uniref:Response regulator transcription factor n=1 Tax=Novosphingobium mangrovi (ex Hu et al. 2023) TaxID=2930094 RepID=A0ABT0AFS5_9SPHN|nr:response regulator transcription factor [Novosphingobium mangrovi (ex Hu et al. 2023)]MCJ1962049.1 response regulator transcription factor [Novosphingobium mangrovi (ex Hu et al. 2023)]
MNALAGMERAMGELTSPDKVLIVDDHSLVRDGLRSIFDDAFPTCEILEADSLQSALEALDTADDVDLVLLDLNIPDVSHLSGLEALRDRFPATPVVMVSGVTDRNVVRDALAAGAAGFVPKSLKRTAIVEALQLVLSGEIYMPELECDETQAAEEDMIRARIETLTPQQRVVLGHLVAGRLNKQIAFELDVSMTTVKAHVSAILQKMNVFSRTQAVIMAGKIGFRG